MEVTRILDITKDPSYQELVRKLRLLGTGLLYSPNRLK